MFASRFADPPHAHYAWRPGAAHRLRTNALDVRNVTMLVSIPSKRDWHLLDDESPLATSSLSVQPHLMWPETYIRLNTLVTCDGKFYASVLIGSKHMHRALDAMSSRRQPYVHCPVAQSWALARLGSYIPEWAGRKGHTLIRLRAAHLSWRNSMLLHLQPSSTPRSSTRARRQQHTDYRT